MARFVKFDGVQAVHETEKAILCEFENGFQDWVPKSQLGPRSQVRLVGDSGVLEVNTWLANRKGWADLQAQPPESSPVDITQAHNIYRRLAAKYHPDRSADAQETMTDINELWQAVIRAIRKATP